MVEILKDYPDKGFPFAFEYYRAGLYAHALRLMGQRATAKDAVQDTFITALTKIDQLRDKPAIKYWLHTILGNHCRMYLRRTKREFSEGAEWGDLPEQTAPAAASEEIQQIQRRESVLGGLSEIPEKLRLPLLLRYYSGFNSYRQIADILAIPTGTVRSRLSRAKRRLLDRFDQEKTLLQHSPTAEHCVAVKKKYEEAIRAFYQGKREPFLHCFSWDLQLRFTSGREEKGRRRWAKEWEEDLESGVRFQPNEILTSGNLTILEGVFKNPPHDPYHCPPAGAFVLFHKKSEVCRVHIHYANPV